MPYIISFPYTSITIHIGGNDMSNKNKDKIMGEFNEFAGNLKNDKTQELKGKAQQKAGEAKDLKDNAKDKLDDATNLVQKKGQELKDGLSNLINND